MSKRDKHMPHDELHQKKKTKNLAVLAIILGLVAIIWAVSIVKMTS